MQQYDVEDTQYDVDGIPSENPSQALSIVSLVLGALSLPIGCCCGQVFLNVPLSIAAIVTGIVGIKKAKAGTGGGHGIALAGTILGAFTLIVITGFYTLYYIFGIGAGLFQYINESSPGL